MNQDFSRMTDKTHKPTEEEIIIFIGKSAKGAWFEIKRFLEERYDSVPETVFYGARYGWNVRYRKKNKTLCSFFPEKGGLTILIVLGKKEAEKALLMREELSTKINRLVENTKQLHDGRWIWIRLEKPGDTKDVMKLLQIKRKPKNLDLNID
jgi:hypothetical protein